MSIKTQPPSRLTEAGASLRALITSKSQTPEGFIFEDASVITKNQKTIGTRCGRMVKAGQLYKSKVPGHNVRFHATPELSEAWIAVTPPALAKREKQVRKPKPESEKTAATRAKGKLLLSTILRCAATPSGFSIGDIPAELAKTSAWARCQALVKAGEIVPVKADFGVKHYFTTQAAADEFRAAFVIRSQKRRDDRIMGYAQAPKARVSKVYVSRKPYSPPKPKVDAEIIYPIGYKHTVRLMPPPRFQVVSLPGVHYGMGAMR